MSKEILELFRPEIEEAANEIKAAKEESDKRAEESDKRARELENTMQEAVIELKNMDITVTQIAKIMKLPESKIHDILRDMS
jgi:ribosomal protein S25